MSHKVIKQSELKKSTVTWTLTAMFVALSVLGAAVKVPFILTSVSLDSTAALIAGGIMGPGIGAAVGLFGHLASSFLGGLPLGPFHIVIAAEMAVLVYIFSSLYKKGWHKISVVFFILGNAILAPLPFWFLISPAFYAGMVPALLIASSINALLSIFSLTRLKKTGIEEKLWKERI